MIKINPAASAPLRDTIKRLQANPFDPGLRTHKLSGEMDGAWSCGAGYDLRIIFEFTRYEGKEAVLLMAVGTHDEVY